MLKKILTSRILNHVRLYLYKYKLLRKRPLKNTNMVFIDGFTYSYPWGRCLIDQEQQYYSDNNITKTINGYNIHIKKEHVIDNAWWNVNNVEFDYTSGILFSDNKYLYGVFEVEINIPKGLGLWSAFWLFGAVDGRFSEIDIMEYYSVDKYFKYNTHYGENYENNLTRGSDGIKIPKLEEGWYKYRMIWDKKYIKVYIDDYLVGIRDSIGCDIPLNLIINMAIQKNINNKLDKSLPAVMNIRNIKYSPI